MNPARKLFYLDNIAEVFSYLCIGGGGGCESSNGRPSCLSPLGV